MAVASKTQNGGPRFVQLPLKLRRTFGVVIVVSIIVLLRLMRGQVRTIPRPLSKSSPASSLNRVAKVSMSYGKLNNMYERALRSHQRHAKRWGYPMHILRQDIAVGFWNKPSYLMHMVIKELSKPVGERTEWLMWVDADSIILNPSIPVEIFLPPSDLTDIHLVASRDQNGLNTGIIFVHVHPWSITMLTETLGYPLYYPEKDLGRNADQEAMVRIFRKTKGGPDGKGYADHVIFLPRPLINAYQFQNSYEGDKGSFLVHFPGLGEKRWPFMAKWLNIIETAPHDWEVPLAETGYVNTTDVFWNQVREAKRTINLAEKKLDFLKDVPEGMVQKVNSTRTAVATLQETIRERADDLELVQEKLTELLQWRKVIGW